MSKTSLAMNTILIASFFILNGLKGTSLKGKKLSRENSFAYFVLLWPNFVKLCFAKFINEKMANVFLVKFPKI